MQEDRDKVCIESCHDQKHAKRSCPRPRDRLSRPEAREKKLHPTIRMAITDGKAQKIQEKILLSNI